jgi:hypothetical protein
MSGGERIFAPYARRPQEKGQARHGVPIHVGDPTALAQVLPKAHHLKATRQWAASSRCQAANSASNRPYRALACAAMTDLRKRDNNDFRLALRCSAHHPLHSRGPGFLRCVTSCTQALRE